VLPNPTLLKTSVHRNILLPGFDLFNKEILNKEAGPNAVQSP
jgi:hypothetical protein